MEKQRAKGGQGREAPCRARAAPPALPPPASSKESHKVTTAGCNLRSEDGCRLFLHEELPEDANVPLDEFCTLGFDQGMCGHPLLSVLSCCSCTHPTHKTPPTKHTHTSAIPRACALRQSTQGIKRNLSFCSETDLPSPGSHF